MSSFQTFLKIGDRRYELNAVRVEISQLVDTLSRPASPTQGGKITTELNTPDAGDPTLIDWMISPTKRLSGKVIYKRIDSNATLKTITFYDAYCVDLRQLFDGTGQSGQLRTLLTISPRLLSMDGLQLDNRWPDEEMQSVPGDDEEWDTLVRPARSYAPNRVSVIPPPVLPLRPPICKDVAAATDMTKPKQARYSARMAVIQAAKNQNNPEIEAITNRFELNNRAIERAKLVDDIYIWDKDKLWADTPQKYQDRLNALTTTHPPEGWKVLSPYHKDPETGFVYAVYESEFEKPAKPVLVFRGSDNADEFKRDWIDTNLANGLGDETEQYTQSIKKAQDLVDAYGEDGFEIAGHSKAGGQAAAASVVSGAKGYIFNAAGVHDNTLAPYGKSRVAATVLNAASQPLVDSFNFPYDVLSYVQDQPEMAKRSLSVLMSPFLKAGTGGVDGYNRGTAIGRKLASMTGPLAPYLTGMAGTMGGVLGTPLGVGIGAVTGVYKAGGVLINGAMPTTAGIRHILPAQDLSGNPLADPGLDMNQRTEYHGMPYLINSMEKQKQDDLQNIATRLGC